MPYKLLPPEPESSLGTGLRNIASVGSRIGAAVFGKAGDIASGATGLINAGLQASGANPKILPKPPPFLPTTEQIRGFVEEKVPYLKPQSQSAEKVGDIAEFLTSVVVPPFGASKAFSIPKALGTAIIGEGGAQAVKALGGGKFAQETARIGSSALTSLLGGRKAITQEMNNAYKDARTAIKGKTLPESFLPESIKNKLMIKNIGTLDKIPKRIINEADKKFLTNASKNIDKLFAAGHPPSIEDLWNVKMDLNAHYATLPSGSTSARITGELLGNVDEALKAYALKNKDFGRSFLKGEELFKGLNASEGISKFIRENTKLEKVAKKPLTKVLLWTLKPAKIAGVIAGGIGLREISKFKDLITKSPEAQKYYAGLLKGALHQNNAQVLKNLIGFDRLNQEPQSKGRYVLL